MMFIMGMTLIRELAVRTQNGSANKDCYIAIFRATPAVQWPNLLCPFDTSFRSGFNDNAFGQHQQQFEVNKQKSLQPLSMKYQICFWIFQQVCQSLHGCRGHHLQQRQLGVFDQSEPDSDHVKCRPGRDGHRQPAVRADGGHQNQLHCWAAAAPVGNSAKQRWVHPARSGGSSHLGWALYFTQVYK